MPGQSVTLNLTKVFSPSTVGQHIFQLPSAKNGFLHWRRIGCSWEGERRPHACRFLNANHRLNHLFLSLLAHQRCVCAPQQACTEVPEREADEGGKGTEGEGRKSGQAGGGGEEEEEKRRRPSNSGAHRRRGGETSVWTWQGATHKSGLLCAFRCNN